MKKIVILVVFMTTAVVSFSQIGGMKFNTNPMYYNPAYAGLTGETDLSLGYFGAFGNNLTNLSFSQSLMNGQVGIGTNVGYTTDGFFNKPKVNINVSYHHTINENHKISLGARVGAELYNPTEAYLELWRMTKEEFGNQFGSSLMIPEIKLGVTYSTQKGYLSITAPNFLPNKLSSGGANTTGFEMEIPKALTISGGLQFSAFDDNVKVQPSVTYQRLKMESYDGSDNLLDLNTSFMFNNGFRFNIGMMNYLGDESPFITPLKFDVSLGYMMKNGVRISGQLDIIAPELRGFTETVFGGSILVGYRISKKDNTEPPLVNHFF